MDKRTYIGMHYKCCNVYQRIYLNKDKTAFVGRCPKCTAKVEVRVDPKGSPTKFFTAE